jgi:hypothetical protein
MILNDTKPGESNGQISLIAIDQAASFSVFSPSTN